MADRELGLDERQNKLIEKSDRLLESINHKQVEFDKSITVTIDGFQRFMDKYKLLIGYPAYTTDSKVLAHTRVKDVLTAMKPIILEAYKSYSIIASDTDSETYRENYELLRVIESSVNDGTLLYGLIKQFEKELKNLSIPTNVGVLARSSYDRKCVAILKQLQIVDVRRSLEKVGKQVYAYIRFKEDNYGLYAALAKRSISDVAKQAKSKVANKFGILPNTSKLKATGRILGAGAGIAGLLASSMFHSTGFTVASGAFLIARQKKIEKERERYKRSINDAYKFKQDTHKRLRKFRVNERWKNLDRNLRPTFLGAGTIPGKPLKVKNKDGANIVVGEAFNPKKKKFEKENVQVKMDGHPLLKRITNGPERFVAPNQSEVKVQRLNKNEFGTSSVNTKDFSSFGAGTENLTNSSISDQSIAIQKEQLEVLKLIHKNLDNKDTKHETKSTFSSMFDSVSNKGLIGTVSNIIKANIATSFMKKFGIDEKTENISNSSISDQSIAIQKEQLEVLKLMYDSTHNFNDWQISHADDLENRGKGAEATKIEQKSPLLKCECKCDQKTNEKESIFEKIKNLIKNLWNIVPPIIKKLAPAIPFLSNLLKSIPRGGAMIPPLIDLNENELTNTDNLGNDSFELLRQQIKKQQIEKERNIQKQQIEKERNIQNAENPYDKKQVETGNAKSIEDSIIQRTINEQNVYTGTPTKNIYGEEVKTDTEFWRDIKDKIKNAFTFNTKPLSIDESAKPKEEKKTKFLGWFEDGGAFSVSQPSLLGVGESGPEDVYVIPKTSTNNNDTLSRVLDDENVNKVEQPLLRGGTNKGDYTNKIEQPLLTGGTNKGDVGLNIDEDSNMPLLTGGTQKHSQQSTTSSPTPTRQNVKDSPLLKGLDNIFTKQNQTEEEKKKAQDELLKKEEDSKLGFWDKLAGSDNPLLKSIGGLATGIRNVVSNVTSTGRQIVSTASSAATGSGKEREAILQKAAMDAGITDPKEMAAFMGTAKQETDNFATMREYASGKNYDVSVNPRKARELGNTEVGDGEKYRGRGYFQLTGKSNYADMSKKLGIDLVSNPELAERPDIAAKIALQYWKDKKLSEPAKRGDMLGVSRGVNLGKVNSSKMPNHMNVRQGNYDSYMQQFAGGITQPTSGGGGILGAIGGAFGKGRIGEGSASAIKTSADAIASKYDSLGYGYGAKGGGGQIDCSGFTEAVYKDMGASAGSDSVNQMGNMQKSGNFRPGSSGLATAEPGDLVFLNAGALASARQGRSASQPTHVQMFAGRDGSGKPIVWESTSGKGVSKNFLSDKFQKEPYLLGVGKAPQSVKTALASQAGNTQVASNQQTTSGKVETNNQPQAQKQIGGNLKQIEQQASGQKASGVETSSPVSNVNPPTINTYNSKIEEGKTEIAQAQMQPVSQPQSKQNNTTVVNNNVSSGQSSGKSNTTITTGDMSWLSMLMKGYSV